MVCEMVCEMICEMVYEMVCEIICEMIYEMLSQDIGWICHLRGKTGGHTHHEAILPYKALNSRIRKNVHLVVRTLSCGCSLHFDKFVSTSVAEMLSAQCEVPRLQTACKHDKI